MTVAHLNNDIRPQIVSAVIRHAYKRRLEVMNHTASELLKHLVMREVGHSHYAMMQTIYDRFPRAINRVNKGTVTIMGQKHFVGGWDSRSAYGAGRFVGSIELPAEYILYHNTHAAIAIFEALDPNASEDLCKMVERYSRDREAITAEAKLRKEEVKAILDSCRTFEQLAIAWPDVMPIANEFRPTTKAKTALAIVSSNLSQALNLPPEEMKEAA